MNTNYPHEIVNDIRSVPKAQRPNFRQLEPSQAEKLKAMTPEQRGEWLKANPIDADRVARAEAKRTRKAPHQS